MGNFVLHQIRSEHAFPKQGEPANNVREAGQSKVANAPREPCKAGGEAERAPRFGPPCPGSWRLSPRYPAVWRAADAPGAHQISEHHLVLAQSKQEPDCSQSLWHVLACCFLGCFYLPSQYDSGNPGVSLHLSFLVRSSS